MACLLPICFCELDYTLSISRGGTIPHTFLVFITIFHKNTPNTGCPVLGVHIKCAPFLHIT